MAANVVAAPIGELAALPFCLAHAVLSWAPPVERGCALVGSGALLAVRAVARASADTGVVLRLPDPTPAQLAALAAAIAIAWAAERRGRRLAALAAGAAAWLLLEGVATRAGAPRGVLRVNVLDVGQGDAILIDLPEGGAMLVDAGGFVGSPVDTGARVLRPLLRSRRRARLDAVVLSHPHPDHFGGLPATVEGVEVGELWDTGQGEAEGAGPVYRKLLSDLRGRGVPIVRPASLCGRPRVLSGATIEVLAPCPELHPDRGANDNSFVLRIRAERAPRCSWATRSTRPRTRSWRATAPRSTPTCSRWGTTAAGRRRARRSSRPSTPRSPPCPAASATASGTRTRRCSPASRPAASLSRARTAAAP